MFRLLHVYTSSRHAVPARCVVAFVVGWVFVRVAAIGAPEHTVLTREIPRLYLTRGIIFRGISELCDRYELNAPHVRYVDTFELEIIALKIYFALIGSDSPLPSSSPLLIVRSQ